jgi:hypothetical protein
MESNECAFKCKYEKKISELETKLAELNAETRIYIRQLGEDVEDIKKSIDNVKAQQISKAQIQVLINDIFSKLKKEEKENALPLTMKIIIELVKVLGTALAIIGGMNVVG